MQVARTNQIQVGVDGGVTCHCGVGSCMLQRDEGGLRQLRPGQHVPTPNPIQQLKRQSTEPNPSPLALTPALTL